MATREECTWLKFRGYEERCRKMKEEKGGERCERGIRNPFVTYGVSSLRVADEKASRELERET